MEWAARRLCAGEACTAIVLGGCSAAAGCTPSHCARLAASEQCPEGLGRGGLGPPGGLGGRGWGLHRGGGGGWAGLARSAALEAAQRRRLHHPGLRAGQRRGGRTRLCVWRGSWPRRRLARLPGQVLEAGGAVLGVGGAQAPRSGNQPGTGGSRWERGGTDWMVRPGQLLCLPPLLSSPPPLETPYSMPSPPSARPASSVLWGGPSATLALPHPSAAPAPLPSPLGGARLSPQPQGTGGRAGAHSRRLTSLRRWGPLGDPGRGEAAPGAAGLTGSARPGSPLGGWGGGRCSDVIPGAEPLEPS